MRVATNYTPHDCRTTLSLGVFSRDMDKSEMAAALRAITAGYGQSQLPTTRSA